MDCQAVGEEGAARKAGFLEQINRGGLTYPSEMSYLVGLVAWNLYSQVNACQEALVFLLNSRFPPQVFALAFITLVQESEDMEDLLKTNCNQKHAFGELAEALTRKLFNCFMKNLKNDINSDIHQGKKRLSFGQNYSSSEVKKLQKLQSQSHK